MKHGFKIYLVLDKAFLSRALCCIYLRRKYAKNGWQLVPNVLLTQCTLRHPDESKTDVIYTISEQFVQTEL